MRTILHIDFDSYFASVEQQANPHLRGKPIGITGGDRMKRTIISTASKEAKKRGVKPPIQIWEAKKICPELILVKGDSGKYLSTTKKFLNILKDYSPFIEVFSIDEAFIEMSQKGNTSDLLSIALEIKSRIRAELGEYITCSIGISYNKVLAKLAGSLYKPDGFFTIPNEKAAIEILDKTPLIKICGIGERIQKRLNNMGVFNFKNLRALPLEYLTASFKSYGNFLYELSRGINTAPVTPFYEKEEVKSIGHRHTINYDTSNPTELKQILLKITELIARRLRAKNLVGKTITCYFRLAFRSFEDSLKFEGDRMQVTIAPTQDGLEIFKATWDIFQTLWDKSPIRLLGVSVSNLKPLTPQNLSLIQEVNRQKIITGALDTINNKFGEFVLQRGILLNSAHIYRKANPFLADRRFKL